MRHRCPVCAFQDLPYPPQDYHVCPCCGTEFGNDDAEFTHWQLREMWVAAGARWFFRNPPDGWNPWGQLIEGGMKYSLPYIRVHPSPQRATGSNSTLLNVGNQSYQVTALTAA